MCLFRLAIAALFAIPAAAAVDGDLADMARQHVAQLIRLDTTNPPGNETRVASYLKAVCDSHGIENEMLGQRHRGSILWPGSKAPESCGRSCLWRIATSFQLTGPNGRSIHSLPRFGMDFFTAVVLRMINRCWQPS